MNSDCKSVVKKVLHQYPSTRSSDKLLLVYVMKKYGAVNNSQDFNVKNFMSMPSCETITRCRREIQNDEGLYKPIEEVVIARGNREQEIKNYYGRV